jgi:hypothetical protein
MHERRNMGWNPKSGAWLLWAIALWCGACAGPGQEQHLAPLYTHISTAGGGEEYEALAGSVIARRKELGTPFDQWGMRPLFLHHPNLEERSRTQILYPFGRVVRGGGEFNWWIMPIIDYRRQDTEEGRHWTLLSLPGLYLSRLPDGRTASAWFPFGGHIEELLSYDELDFVLWPFLVRTKRQGRTNYHFPFPFLSYTDDPHGGGWRIWPLVGHTWNDNHYNRWFAAWPFYNYAEDNLKASPAKHQTKWAIFPLYSENRQGTYVSRSVLWPFFGYASDPATGFWSLDAPWPAVRLQRPGINLKTGEVPKYAPSRTRFWPFWSEYEGDGMLSSWYLWPLVNVREEQYHDGQRSTVNVVPFWAQWRKEFKAGGSDSHKKLWPVFQYHREKETRRYMFPALSPFRHWPELDENYAWIYSLYTGEHSPSITRDHALWGLWRREHDEDEERTYVSGLWSQRDYTSAGSEVTERSLLFGLLRWRSHAAEGLSLMSPAFPGPGWPVQRIPNSIHTGPPAADTQ